MGIAFQRRRTEKGQPLFREGRQKLEEKLLSKSLEKTADVP